ncbi:hypothetical protein CSC94_01205 [Zhengella mangrovi]|uniref:Outer membrane protein beta-barrel domain-containing protein n=1 Tax=Zhengella mangrovi TaxID=1982044 RepID=A0A2G1QT42_9HYPH|nr:TorF family putative porin [Zhengella mangrovi]PHP68649.1 hypothetical protein CSC94_01205 [Zhengella mangrovi]
MERWGRRATARFGRGICGALVLAMPAAAALADDDPEAAGIDRRFDLAFGIMVASDYVDGAGSKSGGKPVVRVYVEPRFGPFFAGVAMANVDLRDPPDRARLETKIYGGLRYRLEPLQLKLTVGRTIYAGLPSENATSLELEAEAELSERLEVEAEVEHKVEQQEWEIRAGLAFKAFEKTYLLAGVGREFGEDTATFWMAGMRYRINDSLSATLAYHGSQADYHKIVGSLSFDTSINRLAGRPSDGAD